jgi:hypothetical protein
VIRARVAALGAAGGAGGAEAVLAPLYRRFGAETPAALAERYALVRPDLAELAKLVAPALGEFLRRDPGPT